MAQGRDPKWVKAQIQAIGTQKGWPASRTASLLAHIDAADDLWDYGTWDIGGNQDGAEWFLALASEVKANYSDLPSARQVIEFLSAAAQAEGSAQFSQDAGSWSALLGGTWQGSLDDVGSGVRQAQSTASKVNQSIGKDPDGLVTKVAIGVGASLGLALLFKLFGK